MKKKHSDSQQASELLKKLQAAVLASSKRKESKQDEPDRDELEFQQKLAGMLSRATAGMDPSAPPKKNKKEKKKPSASVEAPPEETIPEIAEDPMEAVVEEPLAEPVAEETADAPIEEAPEEPIAEPPSPKKPKAKREKKKKKEAVAADAPSKADEQPKVIADESVAPVEALEPTPAETVERMESVKADEIEPIETAEAIETVEIDPIEPGETAEAEPIESTDPIDPKPTEEVETVEAVEEQPPKKPETVSLRLSVRPAPPTPVPEQEPTPPAPKAEFSVSESPKPKKPSAPESPRAEAKKPEPQGAQPIVIPRPSPDPTGKDPKATQPSQAARVASGPIRITPPDYRKEDMKKNSQKTQEGVSLPRERGQDRIVITPSPQKTSSQPIVIKPRDPARTAEPAQTTPVAPPSAPVSVCPPVSDELPNEKKAPRVEKKPSRNPSVGVSLPRTSTPQKSKPTKKRPTRVGHTPISHLPEDDLLDEALDEIVAEEAMTELLPLEEPEVIPTPKKQSIFDKRREKKEREAEKASTAVSLVEQKTGLTEDDVAMILELGYENDLGRLVGYETLKRLKYDYLRKTKRTDPSHFRTALGYRNTEYTGKQSPEKILSCYARDRLGLILRTVFTVLIALILVPVDFPFLLGTALTPYVEAFPLILPLSSLLLLTVASLLSVRQLDAGLRSLFRFTPTPYSVNALLVPIAFLYGALSLLLPDLRSVSAALPTVCSLAVGTVGDAIRLSCEMQTFRVISSSGEKTVLDPAEPRKKKLRQGEQIVKILNDDMGQSLYRVRRAERVMGFFRRCNDFSTFARPFTVLLTASLSVALLSGLVAAVMTATLSVALSTAMLALLCTLPVSAILLCFSSLQITNRRLARSKCTLVGEESVEEYAAPKTVIFNDSDMYHAQKCTQVSVREGEDFRQDMRIAGILFRKMSGTLGSLGQNAPLKNAQDPPVAFVRLTENGTEAVVDNRHVLAGNAEFMARSGVRVPRESTDRTLRRAKNVSLMYVAIDGSLKLAYEIEYTVSDRFEALVELLAEHGTETAIQTYDPNINDSFLRAVRPEDAEYVRVIKPGRYETDAPIEITDSGAVALGDGFDVTLPTVAASKIKSVRRTLFRILLALSILFAIPAVLLGIRQGALLPGSLTALPLLLQAIPSAGILVALHAALGKSRD